MATVFLVQNRDMCFIVHYVPYLPTPERNCCTWSVKKLIYPAYIRTVELEYEAVLDEVGIDRNVQFMKEFRLDKNFEEPGIESSTG